MKGLLKIASTTFLALMVRFFVRRYDLPQFQRVLILAPHPDDEIFGLGGSLLQMKNRGVSIHLVYVTDGEGSAVWPDKEEIKSQRRILSEKVCRELNILKDNITRLQMPDGAVPKSGQKGFEDTVKRVRDLIDTVRPDVVYTTHILDYWPFDHVACSEIAMEAIKQAKHKPQLWQYWVWAWYNMKPWQVFGQGFRRLKKIDIRDQITQKMRLKDLYLKSFTLDGKPWSGILPQCLLKSLEIPFEIVQQISFE